MHYKVLLLGEFLQHRWTLIPTQGCHSLPTSSVPVCNYVITYVTEIQTTEEQIVTFYHEGTTGSQKINFQVLSLEMMSLIFRWL